MTLSYFGAWEEFSFIAVVPHKVTDAAIKGVRREAQWELYCYHFSEH